MSVRISEQQSEQARIKEEIARLQAQLLPSPERPKRQDAAGPSGSTKRVLVAASPSPKKRKLQHAPRNEDRAGKSGAAKGPKPIPAPTFKPPSPPRKSAVAAAATAFQANRASRVQPSKEPTPRSTGFAQPAPVERPTVTRNDDMTVKEELPIGPTDHPAPFDDPRWERTEPYSGIHLSSRKLPFDEFQEFMYGRVYLSPSRLYSVVRLSSDRAAYDVPVDGDWITIAVVAERGQVQISKRGGKRKFDQNKPKEGDNKNDKSGEQDEEEDDDRPTPKDKKYMRLLLVDFGHRAAEGKPAPKDQYKGDALLNMLLFEADSAKTIDGEDGRGKGKNVVYKGGSGGAFEKCSKLREGAVLAILNPRILKPFQRTMGNPHPRDNALAITPENADSIEILGYSRDLGSCGAVKRDGNACGSWCDKRVSNYCEYHIQNAIQSKRAARPEFTAGTADLTAPAQPKSKFAKPAYDPSGKWGLLPSASQQNAAASYESAKLGGGATYVVDGHVLPAAGGPDASDVTRLKALKKKKQEELALEEILRRDGGKTAAANILKMGVAHLKAKKKGGAIAKEAEAPPEVESANDAPKKVYSAELVKSIGYDPSKRAGNAGRPKEGDGARQLTAIADRKVELRPPPGAKRLRSNVTANFAPSRAKSEDESKGSESSSDSGLEFED
ncbi:tetracycline resistance protein from transposon [Ceratobasidium sp. AG-Ba]|nr:tetracycline resistance protein from transposon [Ceratobasidium sp. AG-Ba]QRV99435.1 tetracycline resistance protein from transposon [Ceratobasidium sp. AG-Ba]